jgi:hypothetical protein
MVRYNYPVKNIKIKLLGLNWVKGVSIVFKFSSKIQNHRENTGFYFIGQFFMRTNGTTSIKMEGRMKRDRVVTRYGTKPYPQLCENYL